jgi:hypothetical protein
LPFRFDFPIIARNLRIIAGKKTVNAEESKKREMEKDSLAGGILTM